MLYIPIWPAIYKDIGPQKLCSAKVQAHVEEFEDASQLHQNCHEGWAMAGFPWFPQDG
jgi:hypothetical protein